MKYIVYIGEGCHDCHLVQEFISENALEVDIIDVDKAKVKPAFDIFVRPALMRNETLVAYGLDVIDHLKAKVMNT
ncbi:MAG: hypothetical protein ACI9GM_001164 [Salibacteraceae bacterium]|jgi:hypothetical protein